MENVDFGKIVNNNSKNKFMGKAPMKSDAFYVSINLSELWGARRVKLEGEVPDFCDEDGNEDFICIPIHRNNMSISENNNVCVKFYARRQIYTHNYGSHFIVQKLTKELTNLRNKLGIHNILVGFMRPISNINKKK